MTRSLLSRYARMWSVVAFAGVAGATAAALAQSPGPGGHPASPAEPGNTQAATMAPGRMQMMMQRSVEADQKLAGLVTRMNAARGDQKVAAIADVVTEFVAQRTQMHEQMRMQTEMMERMMSHMSSMHGAGGMMNKAPGQAPVPAPAPKGDEHSTHHPER